jgi:predicted ATPase
MAARIPWVLGYPDQAAQQVHEALSLAYRLRHPLTLGYALGAAAIIHQLRREPQEVLRYADTAITLCTEHGLSFYLALGRMGRGWALTEQGEIEEGVASLQQGLTTWRALGAEIGLTHYLTPLIEAHRKAGHLREAEAALAEAFTLVEKNAERFYEAELYRLKGELVLQSDVRCPASEVTDSPGSRVNTSPESEEEKFQKAKSKRQKLQAGRGWRLENGFPSPQASSLKPLLPSGAELEAEECFRKAITIARQQQAKSLELRAVMSLVRLRRQQAATYGTCTTNHATRNSLAEAHKMLAEVYNWFTEGFDTTDLREAKALLDELR